MKKNFSILVIAMLYTVSLYSQDSLPPVTFDYDPFLADTEKYVNIYDNGIGLSFSTMSGYGISFLQRFLEDYSVLLSGFITYNEYVRWTDLNKSTIDRDEKNILYDFGIEIQRDIITSNRTKIFALIGASYSTETRKNQYYYSTNYNDNDKKIFSIGAGFGLQWFMAKNFAGYFHFGYKFENTDAEEDKMPSIERKTTVGIGLGVLLLF